MVERWIPSGEVIELLAQRYYASKRYADYEVSLAVAEDAILQRLSSGALRARAAKGFMASGDPFGAQSESNYENEGLPAAFWRALSGSERQDQSFDWVLGDFSYSSNSNEYCASGRAFDVHFDASSIPGASLLAEAVNTTKEKQKSPGRPARYDWPKTVLAIFGLIHRGELKPTSKADIERELISHLSDENGGPSESTARPYASMIWEEHCKQ